MATKKKMLQAAAGSAAGGDGFTAIEDVFSTYLYTGNGTSFDIVNGIDLAGEGGLVWRKARSAVENHHLIDTVRGAGQMLSSNQPNESYNIQGQPYNSVSAFNSDGFTHNLTQAAFEAPQASWTFRKAPRFFDVVTYTGDGTSGREIAHNLGVAPGAIILKRLDATSNWPVYHRGIDATNPENYAIELNATDPRSSSSSNHWNSTNPTATEFTIGANYNGNSTQWVAYLFAHDPLGPSGDGSDGLIACGSYTGNGSTDGPEIDLGWEPQWVLVKRATGGISFWGIYDTMRGIVTGTYPGQGQAEVLYANLSDAADQNLSRLIVTQTGFSVIDADSAINASGNKYIYIAIRRGPMRAPESGTEVFDTVISGTSSYTTSFTPDSSWLFYTPGYDDGTNAYPEFFDRLRGKGGLQSPNARAENTSRNGTWDSMTTFSGVFGGGAWMFRRAPNFFDVVVYAGNGTAGRTVSHNLGVVPNMMIVKRRSGVEGWQVYHSDLGATKHLELNFDFTAKSNSNRWNSTEPTSTEFTVSNIDHLNASGDTYIAYLFATLAGVSKVGSYTGNGSSQTIDCGFTTGARFILIKRTDATDQWWVFDTARGIVAANDPALRLDTTDAEVSDDSIDPDSIGFRVLDNTLTRLNVNGGNYIFYAIA